MLLTSVLNNLVYYSLNSSHMCIEIVYTSDQQNVEIEIVYISAQIHDVRTIKEKQLFVIYFPNVDMLMIKGKHCFAMFQILASNLGFMC